MFMVFNVWTQNQDALCALSPVYLSLEIYMSYQLLNKIPDFYELGVSSTRIIPRYQCSTAWLHQENDFFNSRV